MTPLVGPFVVTPSRWRRLSLAVLCFFVVAGLSQTASVKAGETGEQPPKKEVPKVGIVPGGKKVPPGKNTPGDAKPIVIEGQLDDNDPLDRKIKHPRKIHTVELKKGMTYTIDMVSTDFDSHLRVEDAAGKELADNDDANGSLDSQVKIVPEKDGKYQLIAITHNGSVGNYRLTIRPDAAEKSLVAIMGKLADTDPADVKLNHPCKIHRVKLKKGVPYIIDMKSTEFDAHLRIEDADGNELADNDDSNGSLDSQIKLTPEKDGSYQLIAITRNGAVGAYRLTVREAGDSKLKVGKAVEIPAKGLSIDGNLDAEDPPSPTAPPNPCKVYSVKLKANQTYVIDMTSNTFDTYLHVLDAKTKNLASDDDGGEGTNSRIEFRPTEDGVYHVIASSFGPQGGEFNLKVEARKDD